MILGVDDEVLWLCVKLVEFEVDDLVLLLEINNGDGGVLGFLFWLVMGIFLLGEKKVLEKLKDMVCVRFL